MTFTETKLKGVYLIDPQLFPDERGWFARTFSQNEFLERGLNPVIAQTNMGFNHKPGTVRGLHFQYPPASEAKLVRCTAGAIFDAIVDLRPESATYLQSLSIELAGHRMLYIPERFAHGYQTLMPKTEVHYLLGQFWNPDLEGGLPYDDPDLKIGWPLKVGAISKKDREWKSVHEIEPELRARMAP